MAGLATWRWAVLLPLVLADPDQCTSIAVGPNASLEGSAFATHTNDCVTCDPRIARIPAKDHAEGALRPVYPFRLEYPRYVGASRSKNYAPEADQQDTIPIGHIPEVRHTFAYWEAAYPLLNQEGVGFGESTCAAKLVGQSMQQGGSALFSISGLMQVALERCASARCAIDLMGQLGEKYGFFGEDPGMPGAGESLSVVDRKEAWVFHITSGLGNTSATWVAQRVPDDHVAVVANNFIIGKVDCKDQDNFRCSQNIFSNAREAKLCDFDTESDFHWRHCYSPDIRIFEYFPGIPPVPWYATLRTWRVQSLANPELGLTVSDNPDHFQFSVPVRSRVSRTDIMDWLRDHYEGTEFDMTQGTLAGPLGNPNRLEGGPGLQVVHGQFARGISIPRTNYGLIVEAKPRSQAARSIAWFATDVPASSVFVPFFAVSDTCAAPYTHGRQEVFTRDSAWWAFDFVANWMNINYRDMSANHVYPMRRSEQKRVMEAVKKVEDHWPQDVEELNEVQTDLQDKLVRTWWQLADQLVVAFNDGVYRTPDGKPQNYGYPAWWLQMIGFNEHFFRPQWAQWAPMPPPLLRASGPDFLAAQAASSPASLDAFLPGLFTGIAGTALLAFLLARRTKASDYIRLHE